MQELAKQALCEYNIQGVGTTGSGRNLAGALVGADVIKMKLQPMLLLPVHMFQVFKLFWKSADRTVKLLF